MFHQLLEYESKTFTYLIGDDESKVAAIIDPVLETVERDLLLIEELGFQLKYIIETHVHADHVTGAWKLKEATGAKILLGEATAVETADRLLKDGEEVELGAKKIKVIATPGHTNGCTSYLWGTMLFTGDALLIRGCGRTDFQEGSAETLFQSVREKLFSLPDSTYVCPGHEYKGRSYTTIGDEKRLNPRLKLENSAEQFKEIMDGLNLAHPKKIDVAVPANLKSGRPD